MRSSSCRAGARPELAGRRGPGPAWRRWARGWGVNCDQRYNDTGVQVAETLLIPQPGEEEQKEEEDVDRSVTFASDEDVDRSVTGVW